MHAKTFSVGFNNFHGLQKDKMEIKFNKYILNLMARENTYIWNTFPSKHSWHENTYEYTYIFLEPKLKKDSATPTADFLNESIEINCGTEDEMQLRVLVIL